jgi:hypothetical protein
MHIVDLRESTHSSERRVIPIDQRRETPLRTVPTRYAEISYLYARSSESRSNNIEGQDYLVFKHDERTISFAVCDGVGQSFCGHLAAEFLGSELVEWLGELDPVSDEGSLASRVTSFLNELISISQQRVLEYALPANLPPLVKAALEGQRAYGSETMFICGRLQFPQDPTDLCETGRLLLCWLGDTEAQILDREGQPTDIGARGTTQERWSMVKGIKGTDEVHAWIGDLSEIGRIIAYSDGLSSVANRLYELVNMPEILQQETERIYNSADSDDISLIDIRLRFLPYPMLFEIENPWRLGSYELQWSTVQDANEYILEEARSLDFEGAEPHRTGDTFYRVEGQPAGEYFYRVTAIYDGIRSEPSNVQPVRTLPGMDALRFTLLITILPACLILAFFVARVTLSLQ